MASRSRNEENFVEKIACDDDCDNNDKRGYKTATEKRRWSRNADDFHLQPLDTHTHTPFWLKYFVRAKNESQLKWANVCVYLC